MCRWESAYPGIIFDILGDFFRPPTRPMAGAGMVRAFRTKGASMTGDMEEVDDTEPAYLVHFPKPPNIVKDTQMGVLLGRQVARKPL